MISNLSNSLRVLSMYNVAAKHSFTTAYKVQLRDIHLHQPMLKSIEEKLGLPTKPKKPVTPYFRFMKEVRPTLKTKNPKLKATEIVSMIAKMWDSMDANKKGKYSQGFSEESAAYAEQIAKYRNNLSEEDVRKIKEVRFEQKARKSILLQKKKCRDLGKPKKPISGFIRFLHKQPKDRQPKETQNDFVKRVSDKWHVLSDAEKAKYYLTEAELANHKKAMTQWENEMRKLGHFDIVSGEPELAEAKPKRRSRKSSVE